MRIPDWVSITGSHEEKKGSGMYQVPLHEEREDYVELLLSSLCLKRPQESESAASEDPFCWPSAVAGEPYPPQCGQ